MRWLAGMAVLLGILPAAGATGGESGARGVRIVQAPEVAEPEPLPRFRDERSDFVRQVRDQMAEFERYVQEMRAQLGAAGRAPPPAFRRAAAAFEERVQAVMRKLEEVQAADVDTWQELQPDVTEGVAAVKAAYGQVLEGFR